MKKILSLLFAFLCASVMMFAGTDVVKMKGFGGLSANSYQNVTVTGTSENGVGMVAYAFNASTGQVRGNKTAAAGETVASADAEKNWSLYNTEAMPGAIKSIKVTQTAATPNAFQNNIYVALGTESQGAVTSISGAVKSTLVSGQEFSFSIDETQGYTYFKILSTEKFTSNSVTGVVVEIEYAESGEVVVTKPTFTPAATDFAESLEITLAAEEGADIYYTLNGDQPTTTSTKYDAPFTLTESTTVKAIAVKDDVESSVAEQKYCKQPKTCAEAKAKLEAGETFNSTITLEGYITEMVEAYKDNTFGNATFWIADVTDGGQVLEVYRGKPATDADQDAVVGDYVRVTGSLVLYSGTPEFTSGASYTIVSTTVEPEPEPTEEVIVSFTDDIGQLTYTGSVVAGYTGQKYDENKTTPTNTITFPNSYTSDGAAANYVTIAPAEGGFKAGDVVTMCAYYNNSDPKDARLAIYNTNDEQLFLSEKFINGKLVAGVPQSQSYTLTADAEYLRIARANLTGESATRVNLLTLEVVRSGATDVPPVEELTPATWYGAEQFVTGNDLKEWTAFVYGITRNADKTLTYEMEFANSVTGLVVEINDGDYRGATAEGLKYTYTTADTHEDGEIVNGFFWIKYANGVTRIDYTYTVGAENEKPAMPEKPAEAATARILAYGLNVAQDGDNYTFTYTANIAGTEANLVFYADGVEAGKVAIDAPKAGVNTAVVAKSDLPAGTLTWAVELKAAPVKEFGKIYEAETITGRGQAVVNAVPESDFFGYVYYTNRDGLATGGLHVYNPDYSKNGGLYTLGETAVWGSQKFSIDAEGMLWLPDYTDGTHSGVWIVDPADLTKTTQFYQGERQASGLFVNNGENVGGSTPCAYIYGEGANTKLYVIDEDMPNYSNGLMIYNVGQEDGTIAHTWGTAPSQKIKVSDNAGGVFSIAVDNDIIWLCQNRGNGSNNSGAYALMAYNHEGTCLYKSTDATMIPGSLGGGIVIDKEGLIYMPDSKSNILVLKPTYGEDAITVEKVGEFACGYAMISSMSFDYAGNLVASVSNSSAYGNSAVMRMAVFAMPTDDNTVVVPAKKALTVEGEDKPVVDMGPIVETYFATRNDWADDNESSASWDAETETILVDIVLYKEAQWQAQVKVNTTLLPVPATPEAGKKYDISLKMKANKDVNGVTLKYMDNNPARGEMLYEEASVQLTANEEYVYTKEAVDAVPGNNIFVFDFGFAAADTQIEIYDIKIVEVGTGTALDNTLNNAEVKKVMIDGQVYIIRDGVRYNMMGMQVR